MLAVTEFDTLTETSTGYTIGIALSPLLLYSIKAIEAQAAPGAQLYQTHGLTKNEDIVNFLNSPIPPPIAVCQTSDSAIVFFNKSLLPYTNGTNINLVAYRKAQSVESLLDNCDVPDQDRELFEAYILEDAYQAHNALPREVKNSIRKGEAEIGRES